MVRAKGAFWPLQPARKTWQGPTFVATSIFVAIVFFLSCFGNDAQRLHSGKRPLRLSVIVKTGAATAHARLAPRLAQHIRHKTKSTSRLASLASGARQPHTSVVVDAASPDGSSPRNHPFLPQATLQHHFVSDHATRIGDVDVVDILANVSSTYKVQTKFKAYHDLHRQLEQGITPSPQDRRWWELDRYKFVPMHRYAYEQDSQADFHVAVDDDTYVFWPTLIRWLVDNRITPSDTHYIGYRRGNMAYGGAGYILSRALLDATYGAAATPKDFENRPEVVRAVAQRWCGDCALSDVIGAAVGERLPAGRTTAGDRAFVPSLAELLINTDTWREPVCSIHHLSMHDYRLLGALEAELGHRAVRACDVVSRLAPEFLQPALNPLRHDVREVREQNWVLEDTDLRVKYTTCDAACLDRMRDASTSALRTDADACAMACTSAMGCLAWTLHERDRNCDLFREQFFIGRRREGSVSGWQAARIRKTFTLDSCNQKNNIK